MASINAWQLAARAGIGLLAVSSQNRGRAARVALQADGASGPAPARAPAPQPLAPAPALPAFATPAPPASRVQYHGGPVLSAVQVSTVFWEDTRVSSTDVNNFFRNITASSYIDKLSQYATPSGADIGHGSWVGTATLPRVANPQSIAMTDVLNGLVQQGELPPPGAGSVYFFFLPPGTNVCSNDACGWHTYYGVNGTQVPYAAIFDPDDCSCGWGSLFDSVTTIASHELAESITDPYENAWYGNNIDDELADICDGSTGNVGAYQVYQVWSNAANACVPPASSGSSFPVWAGAVAVFGGVAVVGVGGGLLFACARRRRMPPTAPTVPTLPS